MTPSRRNVAASVNEKESDFIIGGMKVEVGGKKKSKKGADIVLRDDIEFPEGNTLPLWMLGFEY